MGQSTHTASKQAGLFSIAIAGYLALFNWTVLSQGETPAASENLRWLHQAHLESSVCDSESTALPLSRAEWVTSVSAEMNQRYMQRLQSPTQDMKYGQLLR